MEILLLITIVIIALAIMNFKDYLSNPYKRPKIQYPDSNSEVEDFKNYQDIYTTTSKEDKIRNSAYGLMIGLMSKLAKSDGKVCELEEEMIANTLEDIAEQIVLQSAMNQKEEILGILQTIFTNTQEEVEELTQKYAILTKGQYKARLKLVEYLLALAYADGVLGEEEREIILDVAAYLEIENSDFNALYEAFANFYAENRKSSSVEESCKVLGVHPQDSLEEIKKAYKKLVREYHPDILHHKGLDKSIIETSTAKLQEINAAYESIKAFKKEESEKKDTN